MRLLRVLVRAGVAILLAAFCAVAPLASWLPEWLIGFQAPFVLVAFLCYVGKLLYDTLFYDHYQP